jgi:hypothetical protein
VTIDRSPVRRGVIAAGLLLLALPLAACSKQDEAEVNRKLDEAGQKAEEKWKQAEPEIKEGVRDAGEAVGKGVEAAGELIQKGGEELQEEARDTTKSTLPDTVRPDTAGRR